jgi:glycosyltransferase involved in cell wall biosynthesis
MHEIDSSVLTIESRNSQSVIGLHRSDNACRKFFAKAIRSISNRIATAPYFTILGAEQYDYNSNYKKYDIYHLHGPCNWIGSTGLRKLIPEGVPVYQTIHGVSEISGGCITLAGSVCDNFTRKCEDCPALKPIFNKFAQLELINKKNFIKEFQIRPIANGEWTKNQVRKSSLFRHLDNIPVVPPIIDSEYFMDRKSNLRESFGIPSDKFVIGMGARSLNDKYKGISEFLNEFSLVPFASKVSILLFGDGNIEYDSSLDVRIFNWINSPADLANLYKACDVYVSPTRMETFGMTLIEAQAVGTPVLCFNVGGVRDAICPLISSNLIKLGDWPALFHALEELLTARTSIPMRLGQRLVDWAKSNFNSAIIAKKQFEIYNSI